MRVSVACLGCLLLAAAPPVKGSLQHRLRALQAHKAACVTWGSSRTDLSAERSGSRNAGLEPVFVEAVAAPGPGKVQPLLALHAEPAQPWLQALRICPH